MDNLPGDFDASTYKELNDDLKSMTDFEATLHYLNFGRNENRQYKLVNISVIPTNFNASIYKELNEDLKFMNDLTATAHYANFGRKENRKYENLDFSVMPSEFDVSIYKKLNDDLNYMSDFEATSHYLNFGRNENRKYKNEIVLSIPNDFDASTYKELNDDLKSMTDFEATSHYLNFGRNENRQYKLVNISVIPTNFNASIYKELNEDLKFMNDLTATAHYINHGRKENRKYENLDFSVITSEFDVLIYKELNDDLKNMSDFEATSHYLNFGRNENRRSAELLINKNLNIINNLNLINYKKIDNIYESIDIEEFTLINNNEKSAFKFNSIVNYYSNLIKNIINDKIIEDNQFIDKLYVSYPKVNYKILQIYDFNRPISEKTKLLNVDLIKVFDFYENKEKFILYPFLEYPCEKTKYINLELNFLSNKQWDYNIINLKKRVDNLNQSLFNVKNINWLTPIRFEAVYNKQGHIGCLMSHINILKKYKDKNVNVLIAEDDNLIIDDNKLYKILNILDSDIFNWDIFLGTVANYPIQLKGTTYVNDIEFLNVVNFTKTNLVYYNKNIINDILSLEYLHIDFKSHLKYFDRYLNLFNTFTSYNVCIMDNKFSEIELKNNSEEKNQVIKTYEIIKKYQQEYGGDIEEYFPKSNKTNYTDNLPDDFDSSCYKEFNKDLKNMTNFEAMEHYKHYGYKEKRCYKDNYFDKNYFCNKYNFLNKDNNVYFRYAADVRQEKNGYFLEYVNSITTTQNTKCILLVNHSDVLYGANHYIYLLYNHLKNKYKNDNVKIFVCEFKYNIDILKKYSIKKEDVLEYYSDPTLLYMLYEKYKPKVVYLNSCNHAIYKIYSYIAENVRMFHSHEIFNDYLLAKNIMPDLVVSNIIGEQYFQYYNKYPKIQPPILDEIDNILELSNDAIQEITNNYGKLDNTKVTIGMCGQINNRKNFALFIEMSKIYLNYNFLWVGGDGNIFDDYVNIYHIKFTINPYKYYKQIIDYFILFSIVDPCPYVILENILLESNVITFSKNIYYNHNDELLEKIYFSYHGEINLNNCADAINKFVKCKKNNTENNGRKYIDKYFRNLSVVENIISEKLENN